MSARHSQPIKQFHIRIGILKGFVESQGFQADKDVRATDRVAPRRSIQTNNRSAGIVTTVVIRKNGTQPSLSASTPLEDATSVRPTTARDESKAYCVAVNAGEQRLER